MTIDAEEVSKKYQEIIQYLDGMKFLVEATKVMQTWIANKS